MIQSKDWRKYETELKVLLQQYYPEANIFFNEKISGRYSLRKRQIDILVKQRVLGREVLVIIDCKNFNKKIDVKQVDSFIGMLQDIGGHRGILITNEGFTKSALNRAFNDPSDIELDIVNFKDLRANQGFLGFPYRGPYGATVPAPLGWIIESKPGPNMIAALFQRGMTAQEAADKKEFLYINIITKKVDGFQKLDDLIKEQEEKTAEHFPSATFKYEDTIKRDDCGTRMRVIDYKNGKFIEYTAFLDFPEFIAFCVLTTTIETVKKNLKKLEYLIEKILPMRTQFQSDEEAAEFHLKRAIKENSDFEAKAYFSRQIGFNLIDRNDERKALWYFKLSNKYKPNNYTTLGPLTTIQLKLREYNDETRKYLDSYYNIDPGNPTIYNELLNMFSYADKEALLIEYLTEKIQQHQSNKLVLGNLHYYLGLAFNAFEDGQQAKENLEKADQLLKQVLPPQSEVFNNINKLRESIKI